MSDHVWTADGKNSNGQIVISHPCGAQERCRPEVLDDVLRSLNREDKIERLNALVSTQYMRIKQLESGHAWIASLNEGSKHGDVDDGWKAQQAIRVAKESLAGAVL